MSTSVILVMLITSMLSPCTQVAHFLQADLSPRPSSPPLTSPCTQVAHFLQADLTPWARALAAHLGLCRCAPVEDPSTWDDVLSQVPADAHGAIYAAGHLPPLLRATVAPERYQAQVLHASFSADPNAPPWTRADSALRSGGLEVHMNWLRKLPRAARPALKGLAWLSILPGRDQGQRVDDDPLTPALRRFSALRHLRLSSAVRFPLTPALRRFSVLRHLRLSSAVRFPLSPALRRLSTLRHLRLSSAVRLPPGRHCGSLRSTGKDWQALHAAKAPSASLSVSTHQRPQRRVPGLDVVVSCG